MSCSKFFKHYRLILWKNWIQKKREIVSTLLEILIPVFIFFILIVVRNIQEKYNKDQCYLQEKSMDSMSTLQFLRDFLCKFSTKCFTTDQVNWNPEIQNDFQQFLNNFSNIYNSFPTNYMNLTVLLQWMSKSPDLVAQIDYGVTYLTTTLSPFLTSLQLASSPNLTLSTMGIYGLSSFICGTSQNDFIGLVGNFMNNNARSKRYAASCQTSVQQFFGKSVAGSKMYAMVAPILFGKIYYTPISDFTQAIITKANFSFVLLDNLRLASIEWRLNFKNWLMSQMINNPILNAFLNNASQCTELNVKFCKLINTILNPLLIKSTITNLSLLFTFFENILSCIDLNKFVGIQSGAPLDNFTSDSLLNVFGAVVFDPSFQYLTQTNATFLNYSIRMPTTRIDSTTNFKVLNRFWTPAPRIDTTTTMNYYTSGFIMLQDSIDRAFIEIVTNNQKVEIGSSIQLMPTPCYVNDPFIQFSASLMPFLLVIAWSQTFSTLVKGIVNEKEKRLKEYMLVMGLTPLVHWISWFTITILTTLISIIIGTFILKFIQILKFSSPWVILILLFSYAVSFISEAFLLSVFFNTANIASVVSSILYFVFYIPFVLLINIQDSLTFSIYFLTSILPQVSFCNAISFIATWEQTMEGIQFSNLFKSTVLNLNFGVGHCIIMLWVDTLICLIFTWYIEAVFPGQFGIPKPWYFFVTAHYWFPKMNYFRGPEISPYEMNFHQNKIEEENPLNSNFEKVSNNLKIGISIQSLTKKFPKMKIPSVNDLSLDFYKSQITAFLGHNGAGKTTTISMLTGIFPPSMGTAFIYNQDIRKDIDNIRNILGLCPQHNILFDRLTVKEHIYFYGLLKGMTNDEIELNLAEIINDVGLSKKRDIESKNLSGGMKRKLSVAMAFIGNSQAIFLDEPTAGVDPYARRGIWDLLQKYRNDEKTIILTTHHMDEADYLSDRIAIISQGKLQCCGSSVFLKRHFGDGYSLIIIKTVKAQLVENEHSVSGKNIFEFIKKYNENAKFIEETRSQLIFSLPIKGLVDNGFSKLFQGLDESLDLFNIKSYGLSDTSLEDVFLKVADDPSKINEEEIISKRNFDISTDKGNLPKPISRASLRDRSQLFQTNETFPDAVEFNLNYTLELGLTLLLQQIKALLIKKYHYTKRNVKGFFAEIVMPIVMVVFIIGLLQKINPLANQPSMLIHPWLMMPKSRGISLNTFYRKESLIDSNIDKITDLFRGDLGESGIRCMNKSIFTLTNLACYSTVGNTWSGSSETTIPSQSPGCDCSTTGYQICSDSSSSGPPPSYCTMASSDTLNNLNGYNISDHLIKKFAFYAQKQYGGFQFLLPNYYSASNKYMGDLPLWDGIRGAINNSQVNYQSVNFVNYFQLYLKLSGIRTTFTRIWVNNHGYVSMPAYINIFNNLLLRSRINSSVNQANYGIVVSSYPFIYTQTDLAALLSSQMILQVSLSNFVIIALSLIPASFVIFLIDERVTGSKRQQFVSGINPYVYWISNFFWDIMKYLISALLLVLTFIAFDYQSYIGSKNCGAFIAILCCYGVAIIPHVYPFSFIISTPSTAFVAISAYNMFVGSITTITTFVLDQLEVTQPSLTSVNNVLKDIFLIFPQYGLGRGLMDISFKYMQFNISNGVNDYNPYDWDLSGKRFLSFGILFIVWLCIIFLIESNIVNKVIFSTLKDKTLNTKNDVSTEDTNVAFERNRLKCDDNDDVLKVVGLSKVYNKVLGSCCKKKSSNTEEEEEKRKLAVNNISFGVNAGECFGLLGVNGAGKTTTFKMLTGEEYVTNGEATINGHSIINEIGEAHANMGFCPQFDALHALLTCEEELYFYCRIRGISSSLLKSTVEISLKNLSLIPHANKTTRTLSGGNKRKLSAAISFIGSPKIIFMDEPTSGMDAGARRFLWNTIQNLTNQKRAVILTSHNMEECEVLCHRLAIMVNGKFRCLGSVQELKSKFGDDYHVTLRMRSNCDENGEKDKVKEVISEKFLKGVLLHEENFVSIQYRMDPLILKLYMIFEVLENLKDSEVILDYSICQTTLDEIFINFAKQQDISKILSVTNLRIPQSINNNTEMIHDKSLD